MLPQTVTRHVPIKFRKQMAALKIVIKQIKSDTRTALGTTRKRVRVPGLRINMKERGIDRHRVSLDLSFCWTSISKARRANMRTCLLFISTCFVAFLSVNGRGNRRFAPHYSEFPSYHRLLVDGALDDDFNHQQPMENHLQGRCSST